LEWLFGDQLRWQLVMVVLSEDPEDNARRGFTPEMLAGSFANLADRYGMPIDTRVRARIPVTVDACRAVVATRIFQPESEAAMLRQLRLVGMGGGLIDDPDVILGAAGAAGIDGGALGEWLRDDRVEDALRADMVEARTPTPSALALDHKLAKAGDGRRYTCPSYEFTSATGAGMMMAPGFQPVDVYEVLLANLDSALVRHPPPESAEEVLVWAGEPLATAEVAAVMGIDRENARKRLTGVAAATPMGTDALWSVA
jgi:hypothetical protein